MDEKIADWLKENVDKYCNPDGRVRVGGLQSAIEASLGTSVGNAELYAWLEENGYVHPVGNVKKKEIKKMVEGVKMGKVGWPKGRPRGKRKQAGKYLDPKDGISEITVYLYHGRVLIPLDEAQRIFSK